MEMQIGETNQPRQVTLRNRQGDFVQTVETLPFQVMPEILMWGHRYWVRVTDEIYQEGACFIVPPHPTENGPIITEDDGEPD